MPRDAAVFFSHNGIVNGDMQQTTLARDYLNANAALRGALGIGDGVVLEPHYLGVGEHNLNYRFEDPGSGRAFVLRVNVVPQPFHDDQVAYEFAALKMVEPSGCTPRALYLDNGPDAPGKGALVISFCEGDELDFDNLRAGDLRCVAQIMANVHAVAVGDECPLHRPADPLRGLFGECLERFEVYRASAFEDARVTKWAETFIAAARKGLDVPCLPSDCRHVVNTETLPSHFLIPAEAAARAAAASPAGGHGVFCEQPGWFVDWERPVVGEVAQDVAYFTSPTSTFWDSEFMFPESQVDQFVQDYWRAVDGRFERGNFDERFRSWRMMTALRSVTWFCRALIAYKGDSGAHTTEKTARKFETYLSDEFMELLAADVFGL